MGQENLRLVKPDPLESGGRKNQRSHSPETLGSRVYKKRGWYHADLRWQGKGRPVLRDPSAPGWPERGPRTNQVTTARQWAAEYDRQWREEQAAAEVRRTGKHSSLQSARDAYLRHREAQTASSTVSGSRTAITHLIEEVGEETDPADVTSAELQELCDDFLLQDYKVSTVMNTRYHLRRFFDYLKITPNPACDVVLPKAEESRAEPWTTEERERIYAAADELDQEDQNGGNFWRRLVTALFSTGLRIQELAAAAWENFDEESRTARIAIQIERISNKAKVTKGKTSRCTVVFPEWWSLHRPDAKGLIFPDKDGNPIRYYTLYNRVRKVLERAGLKEIGVAAHQFRHTFAFVFMERGGSLDELSKSLGHKKISTTQQTYDHFTSEHAARAAIKKIYGDKHTIRRGARKKS